MITFYIYINIQPHILKTGFSVKTFLIISLQIFPSLFSRLASRKDVYVRHIFLHHENQITFYQGQRSMDINKSSLCLSSILLLRKGCHGDGRTNSLFLVVVLVRFLLGLLQPSQPLVHLDKTNGS
jgi:hypothetical protein